MPKVSVVTNFFFDRLHCVEPYLYYLNQQTFKDFELIYIDDGPEVGVLNVLKNSEHAFPIRYYKANRRDPGESAASGTNVKWFNSASLTNFGVEQARGEYVIRCDPEMLLPRGTIEKYYETLIKHDCYCTCATRVIPEAMNVFIHQNYKDPDKILAHLEKQIPAPAYGFFTTLAISKSNFQKTGGIRTTGVGWGGNDSSFATICSKAKLSWIPVKIITIHMFHRRASHYTGAKNCAVTNPALVEIPPNHKG